MKAVTFAGQGGPEMHRGARPARPARGAGRGAGPGAGRGPEPRRPPAAGGLYPPPPGVRPDVPGLELAGEVAAVGEGVSAVKVGDRVMAIAGGEAQAELTLAHERMLVPIPARLSLEEAGATMEAFVTSHDALLTLGGLRSGWPVLIHAVGSGVATAALQLAKAAGATVIGDEPNRRQAREGAGARARPRYSGHEGRRPGSRTR